MFESKKPVEQKLESLLSEERAAITMGDFSNLVHLAEEKEKIAARLRDSPISGQSMERLRENAARNAELLQIASGAIQQVLKRIEILRQGPSQLKTYDKSGQSSSLGNATGRTFERRA